MNIHLSERDQGIFGFQIGNANVIQMYTVETQFRSSSTIIMFNESSSGCMDQIEVSQIHVI